MIRLILSAILLFIPPIQAWSIEEIKGTFECKVKYQNIFEFIESVPKEYNGFKDGIDLGESFYFEYNYIVHSNQFSYEISSPNNGLENFLYNITKFNPKFLKDSIKGNIKFTKGSRFVLLHNDVAEFKGSMGHFYFKRYYKNDWSVVFNQQLPTEIWTLGLDCRHTTDKFDEIFADLKSKDLME